MPGRKENSYKVLGVNDTFIDLSKTKAVTITLVTSEKEEENASG